MKLCPDCKTPKGCKTAGKCLKMGGKAESTMMGKPSTYYSGGGKVYTGRK
jgi:hypothetical protein